MVALHLLGQRGLAVPALGKRLIVSAGLPDRENGAWRISHDALGHAPEHRVQASYAPMRSHDDEVVVTVVRNFDDLAQGVSRHDPPREAISDPILRACSRRVHRLVELFARARRHRRRRSDLELVGRFDVHDVDRCIEIFSERDGMFERSNRRFGTIERHEKSVQGSHVEVRCNARSPPGCTRHVHAHARCNER